MKKVKMYVKAGFFVVAMVCVIAGLTYSGEAAKKVGKVVLSSPFSPLVMPMAYILENNLLQDVAENVELMIWNNPDQLRAIMTRGQADFTSVPSNVASIFYNKGVQLKFLQVSIWGVFYIISSDTSIQSLEDLKGQEIYIPFPGDQPDLVFQTICKQQGIDPASDLKIQYVSTPLDVTMNLIAGKAKHAMMIEPAAAVAIMKAKQKGLVFERVIDIQEEWGKIPGHRPRIPNAGVVALKNMLDRPDVIEAFRKAYNIAVEWTTQHPKEAALLAAKHVEGVNPAAYEESLKYTLFKSLNARDVRDELEQMLSDFMIFNPASVGGELPDEGFYYAAP